MKKLLLSAVMISAFALTPAIAEDKHDDHEERTRHYEVAEPKDWQDAIHILEEKGAEMEAAYATQDYATIHELSYHLEMAADLLVEESKALMDAVNEVHHATEDGEYKLVDEKFPALENSLHEVTGK